MVKSTVRFPEAVMETVEEMIEEGTFSSKSELQRFAVEFILSEATDYEPEIVDFEEIRTEVLGRESAIQEAEPSTGPDNEFVETAARVRQFAVRGDIDTAEEYIDTHYPPADPRNILLDDLLATYRHDPHGRSSRD